MPVLVVYYIALNILTTFSNANFLSYLKCIKCTVKEVEHSDNWSKLSMSDLEVVNVIGNALNSCNYDITPRASHIQLTAVLKYMTTCAWLLHSYIPAEFLSDSAFQDTCVYPALLLLALHHLHFVSRLWKELVYLRIIITMTCLRCYTHAKHFHKLSYS